MRLSPFKWIGVTLGGASFAASASVMVYMVGPAWREAGGHYADILLGAAFVGTLVGGVLWMAAGAFDGELLHALHLARTAAGEAPMPETGRRGLFGVRRVAWECRGAIDALRGKLREETLARRELEVSLAAARSQADYLRAALEASGEAVLVTDGFNELVLANRAAAELLQFSTHSAVRKPVEQVVRDATLVRLIRDAREAGRSNPQACRQVQHRMGGGGGAGTYSVKLQTLSQPDAGAGKPACVGVATVLSDVTVQVESAERRGDFVASVSHELRTPLSSIKGCLEMLIDDEAGDAGARQEFYGIILAETNRLSRLVDNVLNISRIESGAAKPSRERVDVARLAEEAVSLAMPQARAKGLALRVDAAAVSAPVIGDREMLAQVVNNLLGNAIQFTPTGGQVAVEVVADRVAGVVRATVRDTGIGIPADALPHVFDKFYRVTDHTRVAKGTGLGLNLVKNVVEAVHGGTVGVESVAGRGAAFTFALPMADNHPGDPAGSDPPSSAVRAEVTSR